MPYCSDKTPDEALRSLGGLQGWEVYYSRALRILARRGVLEVLPKNDPRYATTAAELKQLQDKFYVPAIGDRFTWESKRSGIRYHCTVAEIRPNGMLIDAGAGETFDPRSDWFWNMDEKQ